MSDGTERVGSRGRRRAVAVELRTQSAVFGASVLVTAVVAALARTAARLVG